MNTEAIKTEKTTKAKELLVRLKDFLLYSHEDRPRANKVICNLMIVSIILCCVMASMTAVQGAGLISTMTSSIYDYGFFTLANIIIIELTTIAMFMLVYFDRRAQFMYARYTARIVLVLLVLSVLACLAVNGMAMTEYFYIFQFGCVIAYQVVNDPNLSMNTPWYNPFSKRAREAAKEDVVFKRDKYMPMNFFNLFWVFMIGCVVGLCAETWFCWFERGVIEDRAGVLFGPFSPIYGFGAVLMTIVLNRFWNKSPIVIFLVSAAIGSCFEFFTSWYLEVAFGICAWDYSSAFLNFEGRTDLAHAIAWGVLGFLWIRFALPVTMRVVDAIKMNWRAAITILAFSAMLVNAVMTIMALDAWSMRSEGIEPQDEVQQFYADNFGNEWMENRFQTMSVCRSDSVHSHLLAGPSAVDDDFVGPVLSEEGDESDDGEESGDKSEDSSESEDSEESSDSSDSSEDDSGEDEESEEE